jgi:dipeptidyl aminopeptidase/acylaminoacyl peptidase
MRHASLQFATLVLAAIASQDEKPWRLVFEQDKKFISVREDGSDRRDEAAPASDGRPLLFISTEDGDAEIWVSDPDGKNPRRLTDNKAIDNWPQWTPDGKRIVFASTRTGPWQIWIMDADGGNAIALTSHAQGARDPQVCSTGGCISYLELHPQASKLPPSTLRTIDLSGGESKVLLEKIQILDHAWSAKGDRLAVRLVQELRILEMPSGKAVKSFKFEEIDKRLYAHAAGGMAWRPDGGAIACAITFLGGRKAGTKIFGDDQIFILPMEGKPVVIETGAPASPVRWIR